VPDLHDHVPAGFTVRSMIISLEFFSDGDCFVNFRADGGVRQPGEDGITSAIDRLAACATARRWRGSQPDSAGGVYPAGGRVDTESSDVRAKTDAVIGSGA
jgi:hypothetical protein